MTPPLLRDHMKPREPARHFDIAVFKMANGYTVTIEHAIGKDVGLGWWVILSRAPIGPFKIASNSEDRTDHQAMDEFDAQMVFDHYVQTYGLLEQVTP